MLRVLVPVVNRHDTVAIVDQATRDSTCNKFARLAIPLHSMLDIVNAERLEAPIRSHPKHPYPKTNNMPECMRSVDTKVSRELQDFGVVGAGVMY
jgi:hypothetical protein